MKVACGSQPYRSEIGIGIPQAKYLPDIDNYSMNYFLKNVNGFKNISLVFINNSL